MSAFVPHELNPSVFRISVPHTPAGRAPSSKSEEVMAFEDVHLVFMVKICVEGDEERRVRYDDRMLCSYDPERLSCPESRCSV